MLQIFATPTGSAGDILPRTPSVTFPQTSEITNRTRSEAAAAPESVCNPFDSSEPRWQAQAVPVVRVIHGTAPDTLPDCADDGQLIFLFPCSQIPEPYAAVLEAALALGRAADAPAAIARIESVTVRFFIQSFAVRISCPVPLTSSCCRPSPSHLARRCLSSTSRRVAAQRPQTPSPIRAHLRPPQTLELPPFALFRRFIRFAARPLLRGPAPAARRRVPRHRLLPS